MTGATPHETKQQHRREVSRKRQATYRQRKAEQGLVPLNLKITAKAHQCLIELKTHLGKGNLADAVMDAVAAQHTKNPPLPRLQSGDPLGVRKQPFWVTQEISDCLDCGYKHRWHALSAFIIAHHAQVCGAQ